MFQIKFWMLLLLFPLIIFRFDYRLFFEMMMCCGIIDEAELNIFIQFKIVVN